MPDVSDVQQETDEDGITHAEEVLLGLAAKQLNALRDIRLLLLFVALMAGWGGVIGLWAAFGNFPFHA